MCCLSAPASLVSGLLRFEGFLEEIKKPIFYIASSLFFSFKGSISEGYHHHLLVGA